MSRRSRFRKNFLLKFVSVVAIVIFITIVSAFVVHNHDAAINASVNSELGLDDKSSQIDEKAKELMSNMTIEDKIRQMFIIEMRNWRTEYSETEAEDGNHEYAGFEPVNFTELHDIDINTPDIDSPYEFFSTYHYGGIIMFSENVDSPEQITTLNSDLQKLNAETGGLPLFIAVDQEGGYVNRLPSTLFPGNMAIAATGNLQYASTVGWNIGDELSLMGFNVDFAPDADVNTNPKNPVIGIRSFGDDPSKVADFAVAFADGLEKANIISCAKHFPGHGDTAVDSHTDLPIIDRSLSELKSKELVPFQALIDHGVDMIMTAHIALPNVEKDSTFTTDSGVTRPLPATLSDDVITGLLRHQMNYDGVVITDILQMSAIQDNFMPREAIKLAIDAGVDIFLAPYNISSHNVARVYERLVADLAAMVNSGEIPSARIDESVGRILRLKIEKGLMDNDYQHPDLNHKLLEVRLRVRAASRLAEESDIAEDAVTIYRGADLLPLDQNQKILIVPANIYQGEVITHTFAKTNIDVKVIGFSSADEKRSVADAIQDADLLILTSSNLGSSNTEMIEAGNALIALAKQQGIPSVVISTGLPYDVVNYPDANIVLAVYNPTIGFVGGPYPENIPAALRVLFGVATSPQAGQGSLPVRVE